MHMTQEEGKNTVFKFHSIKEHLGSDATSGFLVFLLALPLSLGIAKASDFPAIYGLVTAIIGGMVVSFFMGSPLTIKGPAAGLIVICSGAVSAFGGGESGWQLALGAIVVSGLLQIAFGLLKFGDFADFFPGATIRGMLAAIGIIIISKQIHVLLGIDPALLKGKEPLELLGMIPYSIEHENSHLAEIGIACLIILFGMNYVKNKNIKKIPAPLVVLFFAIPLGYVLHIKTEGAIQNFALVEVGSIAEAMSQKVIQVNFDGITNHTGTFIQYVLLFSVIGTIESLLTAKAIDGQDPYKRKSNFNKDIIAVGIGNTLSGLLGGLPMISEVARSSANVSNGAKTRWANFFHGFFLLVALLVAVPFIERIPNAALAAMLIYVGFRLAHPREFKHILFVGKDQFIVFLTTLVVTVASDLLIGVATGIALEMLINLYHGATLKGLFKANVTIQRKESTIVVRIYGEAVFSNVLSIKKKLESLEGHQNVTLDVSQLKLADHTTLTLIHQFKENYENNGGTVLITGFENHKSLSHHKASTKKIKTVS